jgi:cold shock CspA family protein
MRTIAQGQRFSYDLQQDRPGKVSATNLKLEEQQAASE